MPHIALVTYYCLFILLASIAGGMIPMWLRLTHRWMEVAVSFVAGVMLGVAVLVMLPHAVADAVATQSSDTASAIAATMGWLLFGILTMFFIERFFCYHHHDVPDDGKPHSDDCGHTHHHDHAHHDLTWSGAALGMTLHSILDGVALAASVQHGVEGSRLAGFGAFLVIFLHKPFDSMTIATLMARGNWSPTHRNIVNGLFALTIPLGALLFYLGMFHDHAADASDGPIRFVAYALAFSAGTFLCIACSDLLPELQFHQHDRVKLSAALLFGLAVAWGIARLDSFAHGLHKHEGPPSLNADFDRPTDQSLPRR